MKALDVNRRLPGILEILTKVKKAELLSLCNIELEQTSSSQVAFSSHIFVTIYFKVERMTFCISLTLFCA